MNESTSLAVAIPFYEVELTSPSIGPGSYPDDKIRHYLNETPGYYNSNEPKKLPINLLVKRLSLIAA